MTKLTKTIYDLAEENNGYLTIREAVESGIDSALVAQLASRGSLERKSLGLYRLVQYPLGPHEQIQEALLWPQALRPLAYSVLSHVTALEVYGLSDVNPDKIHISVPVKARLRRKTPTWMALHRQHIHPSEITMHDGLPITTAAKAIADSAEMYVGPRIIADAVRQAYSRGLISKNEFTDFDSRFDLQLGR